jgi:hypothetical protein
MDGAGEATQLWLFDPNGKVFSCHAVGNQLTPTRIYQREDKGWVFISIEPAERWQPVTSPEMVGLLNEMEKAVFLWAKQGGHATRGEPK